MKRSKRYEGRASHPHSLSLDSRAFFYPIITCETSHNPSLSFQTPLI